MPGFVSLARAVPSLGLLLLIAAAPAPPPPEWEANMPPFVPGTFAELRPARAQYDFGWSGFTAAVADIRLSRNAEGQMQLEATGRTVGLARQLWKFDTQHLSTVDPRTLRPLRVKESETTRAKETSTEVTFTPQQVVSQRSERKKGRVKVKTRTFVFPNAMSLSSALFYLRAKPLRDGEVERVVVYPATTGYLCTVTVLNRESITVPAGSFPAIKLDVKLEKIDDDTHALLPHKKFKRATVWISDNDDRFILRVESQIFIGVVFAELHSVQTETARR